ncbi:hypothetical protein HELRODRAFT_177424 [Helobdella robusta]|uniref:Apple domain-containing protein n=1 Tax=Helobdella robusta TaxID=6412 RepID=T1FBN9_HELRO|nr:hypothetical protein HELRODRAFT_177424 [Helobdella robusta]ESN98178.1 hypothetical protein HELRODRAFT_177424 [Helobdella robusta]
MSQKKNVLLLKPATQSSIYVFNKTSHPGSLAVDGNKNPDFNLWSCYHAGDELFNDLWVLVDMIIPYQIDYVLLWTRKNIALTARMDNFIIGLTNVNYFNLPTNQTIRGKFPLCGVYPYPTKASFGHRVNCSSNLPASRYVIAQQAENVPSGLCVCELKAFPREERVWRRVKGVKMVNYVLYTKPSKSVNQCILMCLSTINCFSTNFGMRNKNCELNNGTIESIINYETNSFYDYWQSF